MTPKGTTPMPDTTAPDEVVVTPTLPGLELPEYHGRKPSGMKTSVTGTGNRIQTAHEIGSKVVLLVEAKVRGAGHEEGDNGLTYVEKLAVVDLYELAGPQGARLLSTVRTAHRTATDGQPPLEADPGSKVTTDASGVVVTPGDAMTLEGDDLVDALTNEARTPVVVHYSDGARELWPDEFDPGDPRPTVGSVVLDDEDRPSVVKTLLDAQTGETVEGISDDEVAHALADYEEKVAAREDAEARNEAFAEDVAVHDQIVGDRAEGAVGDPTPIDQVDPVEANEDLDGDPAEVGFAGDAPDAEVEFVVDDDGFAEPAGPRYTPDDLLAVDRSVAEVKAWVADVDDRDTVLRMLAAEEDGRGRGLKTRAGVVEILTKRAAAIFSALGGIDGPEVPDGAGLEPDAEEGGED